MFHSKFAGYVPLFSAIMAFFLPQQPNNEARGWLLHPSSTFRVFTVGPPGICGKGMKNMWQTGKIKQTMAIHENFKSMANHPLISGDFCWDETDVESHPRIIVSFTLPPSVFMRI